MAVPQVRKTGPRTYTAAAQIAGGQVVEATDDGTVKPATAGTTRHLGVAVTDAVAQNVAQTADPFGNPVINAAPYPTVVSVADSGIELPVVYADAAKFGDALVAAAAGKVTPAGADASAAAIVGKCTQPGGVAAGASGLVRTV